MDHQPVVERAAVSAVGALDIGSNSIRLMIVAADGSVIRRESEVTGLARGVDANGALSDDAVASSLTVLSRFADLMAEGGVTRFAAVATSAARDARNGPDVMRAIGRVLGQEPSIIDGEDEARLSFVGAVTGAGRTGRQVVVDIGGGSTEVVEGEVDVTWSHSYDMGSVRLTDRSLPDRPASVAQLASASAEVDRVLSEPPIRIRAEDVIGVAGTFTSLAAMHLGLDRYDPDAVHGTTLTRSEIDALVGELAALTVAETAEIPSLEPRRAPVILAGTVVAQRVMEALGAKRVLVSEYDLLDGLVARVVALGQD
jgi:exopolyphosphatase/guanosine-5'-triphosphate,3'-diphosphate pyrophosphatase